MVEGGHHSKPSLDLIRMAPSLTGGLVSVGHEIANRGDRTSHDGLMSSVKDVPAHGGVTISESEIHSIDCTASSVNTWECVPRGSLSDSPII